MGPGYRIVHGCVDRELETGCDPWPTSQCYKLYSRKEWRLHSSGTIATSANEPRPALSNSGSFALTPTYDQHKSVFGKYPEIPKTIHSCFGYLCAWVDNDRDAWVKIAGVNRK